MPAHIWCLTVMMMMVQSTWSPLHCLHWLWSEESSHWLLRCVTHTNTELFHSQKYLHTTVDRLQWGVWRIVQVLLNVDWHVGEVSLMCEGWSWDVAGARARDLKLTMSVRELKLPAECGEDPVIATVSIGTVDWSSSSDTSSSFPTLDTGHLIQSHTDTKYIIMGNDRNDTNQQRIKFVNLKSIISLTVHH